MIVQRLLFDSIKICVVAIGQGISKQTKLRMQGVLAVCFAQKIVSLSSVVGINKRRKMTFKNRANFKSWRAARRAWLGISSNSSQLSVEAPLTVLQV